MTTRRTTVTAIMILAACTAGGLSTPAVAGTVAPVVSAQAQATVEKGPTPLGYYPGWRDRIDHDRVNEYSAYSPSMHRHVPLIVISPKDNSVPRPIVYVLNGGDGGEGDANWIYRTNILDFYRDKNVWVVIPMAGRFSYYTDWVAPEPKLGGTQKWETFLTKELPGPLERALGASDKRGIIGMSMSATSSLLFAEHNPGFYDAVASLSGCAETSRGLPLAYVRFTLGLVGASAENMWGPIGGKTWLKNDALLNAARLKGHKLYISNGTGLVGKYDMLNSPFTRGDSAAFASHIVLQGPVEAATNKCAHDLKAKLDELGIPADWNLRPTGTHSWGYWQQDLHDSWPTFARAFNMDPSAPTPEAARQPITPSDVVAIEKATRGEVPGPHGLSPTR